MFCREKVVESQKLLNILNFFDEAYGQEINLSNSEVFFSYNMCIMAQDHLSRILGIRHVMGTGKYLGLPSVVDRNNSIFAYVKNVILRRELILDEGELYLKRVRNL